ncbi:hypothetical protein NP493_403g01021 [Ridgeia piscesae]|uniref:Centrosomal protein of 72 kDa n=1 Tax=Ridgeia piscesae TaxID=27915 RepID=A0AAD9L134_RIDPI|nr:hypothetical protein NP493_403g01021 [Ridgeia piscesae]
MQPLHHKPRRAGSPPLQESNRPVQVSTKRVTAHYQAIDSRHSRCAGLAVTDTEKEMQKRWLGWQIGMESKGLKVNIGKTEVLVSSRRGTKANIKDSQGTSLRQVNKFKYLGVTVSEEGGSEEAVRARFAWAHDSKHCLKMALTISEEWIRERVQLKHNNLEDVRSLSLPGTYHEKIGSLSSSLRNFTRLKSLDLSRNAIDNLAELYRLRYNQRLQDLDLRLNAVARNEPDYRLFLIHMLPNLRRLDDRAVRDTERKAALMHFTPEQATELTVAPASSQPSLVMPPNPRVEHVRSLAKPPSALDENDTSLLDLVAHTHGDLSQQRHLTGSTAVVPEVVDYPTKVSQEMDREDAGHLTAGMGDAGTERPVQTQLYSRPPEEMHAGGEVTHKYESHMAGALTTGQSQSCPLPVTDAFQSRYPNLSAAVMQDKAGGIQRGHGDLTHTDTQQHRKNRVQFAADSNLKFQDEVEAYTSYKAQGYFTPQPGSRQEKDETKSAPPSAVCCDTETHHRGVEMYTPAPVETSLASDQGSMPPMPVDSYLPSDIQIRGSVEMGMEYSDILHKLSDLVDKHWNGAHSLTNSAHFKGGLLKLLKGLKSDGGATMTSYDSMTSETMNLSQMQEELQQLRAENDALNKRITLGGATCEAMDESKAKVMLVRANRDVSILRTRLQKSIEENKHLQDRVSELSRQYTDSSAFSGTDNKELERIAAENEALRRDIAALTGRLKQAQHLQEMASMLQESHKSLVTTNEHLLRELDEERRRHEGEVKQLHWSYDQLKKTAGLLPLKTSNGNSNGNK